MHIAELADYRRAWNYGSEVLRGDWVDETGVQTIGGLVVSLGIVAAPGDSINGVVFAVDDDELADLDWRERAYDRIDITDRITLIDQSASVRLTDPVAVYLPRRAAIARYEQHRDNGTAGIRRSYWDIVDAAFADLGARHAEWYRRTPAPDVPVVDMSLSMLG